MAYNRHVWEDEVVQYPRRITLKDTASGSPVATYDYDRVLGSVVAQDPVNAIKLNNMEIGIDDLSNANVIPFITSASIESLPIASVEAKVKNFEEKGLTLVNIVQGQDILNGNSVTWDSVLNDLYYDSLNETILTGTGASMTATNSSGATADMMIIHLNALGIESYTEEQMLDLVRNGYFDGISNVENPVIESVGKNLFDKSDVTLNSRISVGGALSTTTDSFVSDFIKLEKGKDYKINSIGTGSRNVLNFYDSQKNYISTGYASQLINLQEDGYIRFGEFTSNIDSVQLEEGTTATAYEPYQSSKLTANVPLRSLPNSVTDRIYESNGQIFKEKNVEEYVLQSGDITSVLDRTNYTQAVVAKSTFNSVSDFDDSVQGILLVNGWREKAFVTTGSYVANLFATRTADLVMFDVPLGTTLTQARDLLAGTVIQYQLATPEIINLTEQGLTSGELFSFENGTVYNTSDTFHGNVSFDVATNEAGQREGNLEAVQSLNKRLDGSLALKLFDQVLVSANWVNDTANVTRPFWYYEIPLDVSDKNIPNFYVNPLDKLNGKADDLTNDIESFNGYVRIYAENQPIQNITVDVEVTK